MRLVLRIKKPLNTESINKEVFFMRRFLIKGFLVVLAVMLGYRMRYQLINMALGQSFIRRFVVRGAMSFPGMRSKMMDELI
jgi:hypothetical protein